MSKQAGKCIFCNGSGVTKQHVWPNWMNGVRTNEPGRVQVVRSMTVQKELVVRELPHRTQGAEVLLSLEPPEVRFKRSPMGTMKARVVCRPCNNGWMSRIEEEAKPTVMCLMRGENNFVLTPAAQQQLAAWATLMTCVIEFTDRDSRKITVSQSDRSYLREYGRAPDKGWLIGLGRYQPGSPQFDQRWNHRPMNLAFPPNAEQLHLQSTTLVVGELLIHTRSTQDPRFGLATRLLAKKLWCLWPFGQHNVPIRWDAFPALARADFDDLSDDIKIEMEMQIARMQAKRV